MNKKELIAEMAEISGLAKTVCEAALDAYTAAITKALKKADEVRLVGFGTYYVAERQATKGRNPRTGSVINIPASKQPKFKAGKVLKDSVN